MPAVEIVAVALLVIAAISLSIFWFFDDFRTFIAPDNADRDAIAKELGDTPEVKAALQARFGSGRHWKDASTGLGGLAGLAVLAWIWFG